MTTGSERFGIAAPLERMQWEKERGVLKAQKPLCLFAEFV